MLIQSLAPPLDCSSFGISLHEQVRSWAGEGLFALHCVQAGGHCAPRLEVLRLAISSGRLHLDHLREVAELSRVRRSLVKRWMRDTIELIEQAQAMGFPPRELLTSYGRSLADQLNAS